jgi:hemoglobin/transferrin/lactoferrin receptor protein
MRRSTSLHYSFDPQDNPYLNLSVIAYDSRTSLERRIADPRTADWLTRGFDVRNVSELDKLTLTYGYDYTWEKSRGKTESGRSASETGETHGLYLQADYALTDRWTASGGLRYDIARMTDIGGNDYDDSRLSPNVGLRFEPVSGFSVFTSYNEAFRGVRPVSGMALLSGINTATNDTTLDGEVAKTAEAGFEFNHEGWRGGLTVFTTTIEDAIVYGGQGGAPISRRSAGDIDTRGFTARIGYDWGPWTTDLSYNHSNIDLNGTAVGPGDWLSGVSPQGDKLVLDIGYEMADYNLWLGWTSTFVMAEKKLPASFALNELPAYNVHDISLVWRPTEAHEVSFALTNIFDRRYLDHSTPYNVSGGVTNLYEIGRSARLSATIKF